VLLTRVTRMSEKRKAAAGPRRRRHTAKEYGPDPIDIHVGRQLRVARELGGLTQTDIGRKLGMSFQVVQKYEQGEIRVSASRLFQLSVLMDKPVAYFFAGFELGAEAQHEMERDEIDLVRAFRLIRSPDLRQCLQRLLREICSESSAEPQEE
jgi:transcriptional regulator with XRE-family HTH domain